MRVTKKCNEYFSKPVIGAFEQVSIVLATFVFILWNGYYSESSADDSLREKCIFDYEVPMNRRVFRCTYMWFLLCQLIIT